jgi:hypothetical protein
VWARAAEGQNTADNGELPGLSVFWRTDYLDLAPLGRGVDDRDAWAGGMCGERVVEDEVKQHQAGPRAASADCRA